MTEPSTITATWSQMRWISSRLWLDMITLPPPATNFSKISVTFAAETGSIVSKGSSSTSTLGAWIIEQASAIFFCMPAE